MTLDTLKADWYKRHADLDAEKDFHKKRVAFMIINNEILFLKNSEMSHFTWAKSLGVTENKFNDLVRGYYLNERAVFYKGNFTYDNECVEKANQFAEQIKESCNVQKLEIWCGQKIGKIGEFWPPDFYIKTI